MFGQSVMVVWLSVKIHTACVQAASTPELATRPTDRPSHVIVTRLCVCVMIGSLVGLLLPVALASHDRSRAFLLIPVLIATTCQVMKTTDRLIDRSTDRPTERRHRHDDRSTSRVLISHLQKQPRATVSIALSLARFILPSPPACLACRL